ncbi:MAG: hypothetical protein L6R42_007268, partial [Xanthoria sp. 1 TBL-2021]
RNYDETSTGDKRKRHACRGKDKRARIHEPDHDLPTSNSLTAASVDTNEIPSPDPQMGTSEHLAVANSSSVQSSDLIGQSSTADTAVEAKGISFRRPLAGDVCRGPVYPGNQSDWKYPAYAWYRHDPYLRVYDPQPIPTPAVIEHGPPARPESPSEQLLASTEDGNLAADEDATTPSIPDTLPANDTAMGSVATTVENTDSVNDPVNIPLPTSEVESKESGVSSTPTDSNTMSTAVAPAATTDTAIEYTAMTAKDIDSDNVPVNTPLPTNERPSP